MENSDSVSLGLDQCAYVYIKVMIGNGRASSNTICFKAIPFTSPELYSFTWRIKNQVKCLNCQFYLLLRY